jgi:hypothetical protein
MAETIPLSDFAEQPSLLKKPLSDQAKDRIASKRSKNTAKTLQNHGAGSSIEAPRGARRSFSTGWVILGTSPLSGARKYGSEK